MPGGFTKSGLDNSQRRFPGSLCLSIRYGHIPGFAVPIGEIGGGRERPAEARVRVSFSGQPLPFPVPHQRPKGETSHFLPPRTARRGAVRGGDSGAGTATRNKGEPAYPMSYIGAGEGLRPFEPRPGEALPWFPHHPRRGVSGMLSTTTARGSPSERKALWLSKSRATWTRHRGFFGGALAHLHPLDPQRRKSLIIPRSSSAAVSCTNCATRRPARPSWQARIYHWSASFLDIAGTGPQHATPTLPTPIWSRRRRKWVAVAAAMRFSVDAPKVGSRVRSCAGEPVDAAAAPRAGMPSHCPETDLREKEISYSTSRTFSTGEVARMRSLEISLATMTPLTGASPARFSLTQPMYRRS